MACCRTVLLVMFLSSQLVSSQRRVNVTYQEIIELGADCNSSDSCEFPPNPDKLDIRNCHCGEFCADLGTCCVDSPHRSWNSDPVDRRLKCADVYGTSGHQVFMIDSCRSDWNGDPSVESQCAADGESMSDPLLVIPVTSRRTGLTYRNYFCYRCNENDSKLPSFWHMRIEGASALTQDSSVPLIKFNSSFESWTLYEPENHTIVNISIRMEIPGSVSECVIICRTGVISSCARDWSDSVTQSKCSAYMGLIQSSQGFIRKTYRNVHCALCNHERLQNLKCTDFITKKISGKRPPPFIRLIYVNESHGCDKQSIYDPFFKKCRVVSCALSGYSIVGGECVEKRV